MRKSPASSARGNGSSGISGVILDYGQVLARCPTESEFRRMAEMFNVSFDSFYELWEASRGPYDRGDVGEKEYWLKMAAETNTSLDHEQIEILRKVEVEIWAHPNPGMLDWVSQLYTAGIKTGLLSNMPWDLVKYIRTNCEWMDSFSFKTLSAEVRLIKPDPAIYVHCLDGLGISAEEALFVDDREVNVRAAQALGMHAIQFRSVAELRQDLAALGFPILPEAKESSSQIAGAASPDDRPGKESKFSPLL